MAATMTRFMKIKTTPLYRRASVSPRISWSVGLALAFLIIASPLFVLGEDVSAPYEQEFIITAYYSPLPGQCCYVRGGYVADKILNGEGVRGADGTEVYPGMVAAPSSYAFGTAIALPGIGRFSVHDRGGAIRELDGGAHRLDLWVGYGEEGLARALAFGVRHLRGTVYPVGHYQPTDSFSFEVIPPSLDRLANYSIAGEDLLSVTPRKGESGLSVELLQRSLKTLGFFSADVSGFFGSSTQDALSAFNAFYDLTKEPSNALSERSAATLSAALQRKEATLPLRANVDKNASETSTATAQRLLRFVGFYRGRTDGTYDDVLADAIFRFQKSRGLVSQTGDPGAGRIGPITRGKLKETWNRRIVAELAERYIVLHRVQLALDRTGRTLDRFLSEGDSGDTVTLLQRLLAERTYFPPDKINGNFGDLTKSALIAYQRDRKIIASGKDTGAGVVGPQTLMALRSEERQQMYDLVRSQGWRAL